MKQRTQQLLAIPYYLWIIFFVIAPILLLVYRSFFAIDGSVTLGNYMEFFSNRYYVQMTITSFIMATIVTFVTFILAYPMAYFLTKTRRKDLWLMLIILPTWINLLLKIYAFIGLLSRTGPINHFLEQLGAESQQLLFTNAAFVLVAAYVELPFMMLPIFNSIDEIPNSLIEASLDLGSSEWDTLRRVIFPLSLRGVTSGVQAVFIPSLSLFMLTRLIGGNRVITLGAAVEQHFLVTQNWGMGSTIGVVLLILMVIVMLVTRQKDNPGGVTYE